MGFHGQIHKGQLAEWFEHLSDIIGTQVVVEVTNVKTVVRHFSVGVGVLVDRSRKTRNVGSERGQRTRSVSRGDIGNQ